MGKHRLNYDYGGESMNLTQYGAACALATAITMATLELLSSHDSFNGFRMAENALDGRPVIEGEAPRLPSAEQFRQLARDKVTGIYVILQENNGESCSN